VKSVDTCRHVLCSSGKGESVGNMYYIIVQTSDGRIAL